MKSRTLCIIGVAIYALALLITAPASLISSQLSRFSGSQLRLTNTQGTLWTGHGQLEVSDHSGMTALTEQVTWRWQPAALLQWQLHYRITLEPGSTRPFLLGISWSGIQIDNTDISLPASLLGQGSSRLASLGLTGNIELQIRKLLINRQGIKGSATLQWLAAGSALTPVSPLGDYELYIEEAGSGVHTTLRTLQGPLLLNGQGAWGDGTEGSAFLATAHISPPFQQELAPFLRLIGMERSDGSFELKL